MRPVTGIKYQSRAFYFESYQANEYLDLNSHLGIVRNQNEGMTWVCGEKDRFVQCLGPNRFP